MSGINPYAGGTWAPQYTWTPQYSPYVTPQPAPSYTGTGGARSMPTAQQSVNNLLRVTGPESAKAYSIPPNSSVVLFDANDPVFYLKSTDDSGFATLRTFEFTERAPDVLDVKAEVPAIDTAAFASKEDFQALDEKIENIADLLKGLVS